MALEEDDAAEEEEEGAEEEEEEEEEEEGAETGAGAALEFFFLLGMLRFPLGSTSWGIGRESTRSGKELDFVMLAPRGDR